jgi:NADH:ubiquinone oxidoreductase subunit E
MTSRAEIIICMGSSCFARGNERNLRTIEEYLRDHQLEKAVDLRGSLCMGACADGPNIMIDGQIYHGLDEGTVLDLLRERFEKPQGPVSV